MYYERATHFMLRSRLAIRTRGSPENGEKALWAETLKVSTIKNTNLH